MTVNLSVSVLVPALCIVPDGPTLARLGDLAGATLLADSCRASAPYGLRLEGSDSAIPAPPPASDAAMIVTVAY